MRRLLLPSLAAIAALAPAAPARADDFIASITRDTPIAAYGGALAWSDYDAATNMYRLQVAGSGLGGPAAPIRGERRPFDVSLGPDERGRTVALYTRCTRDNGTKGCDVYRYDVRRRREVRVGSVSSRRFDEAWPVQWRRNLAFVRRRTKGASRQDCDLPYVRRLSSRASSRRLDRGSCASTTGMSIRGTRIIQVTFARTGLSESQVRRLSIRGGEVRVLERQGSGEESNLFSSPSQSSSSAWVTRTGVNPQPSFVRLHARSGRKWEVRAQTTLAGPLARDERGRYFYVAGGEFRGDGCVDPGPAPCRLVRTKISPFSTRERGLLADLTITSSTVRPGPPPKFGDPVVLSGRLSRKFVSKGRVRREEPVGGVPIELLRRSGGNPSAPRTGERLDPAGIFALTGSDGRWSHTLTNPPPRPWFSAITRAGVPSQAGRGTAGTVDARIALAVSGTAFFGTVAPGQPGRLVRIQRLTERRCFPAPAGSPPACIDRWETVVGATLSAAGTTFAANAPGRPPGIYRAAILAEDVGGDPTVYTGASADTPVA